MAKVTRSLILPQEIKLNRANLIIPGVTSVTVTESEDLQKKIKTATMPDSTVRSGGDPEAGESSFKFPMHHKVELASIKAYLKLCETQFPGYKRDWTWVYSSVSGINVQGIMLVGAFVTGFTVPGTKMNDEGNQAEITIAFGHDDIVLL